MLPLVTSFFPQVNLILLNLGLPQACLMTKSCLGCWFWHCGWMVILKNRKKGQGKETNRSINHRHMFPRPSYRYRLFSLYQVPRFQPPPHSPLENVGHSRVSLSSNLIILRTGPRGIMPQTVLGCLSYSICSFLLCERWPGPDKLFVWPVSRSQTTFGNHCSGALQICTHNSSTGLFPSVS